VAFVVVRRWRRAGREQRHVLAPVHAATAVIVLTLIGTLVADLTDLDEGIEQAVDITARVAMACVPFGFLIGLARSRFSRAVAVSALVERLGERRRPLRDALAEALGDPGLSLAFRVGGGYVDASGAPVALPDGAWTPVERDGRPVGAILHDPALADAEPDALRSVAGAAALALDNERLEVELRARIAELRESRTRIVRAGDEERRRLERDLHDGAQQRLVALALMLRLARGRADGEVAELLEEASAELDAATTELRELARGIHPAVLTERGLAPALGALAGRAPLPVELEGVPDERLPAGVESAAYFVVAEALTNVTRYARASHAAVDVRRMNGSVTVEVRDDGVGGADPAAGSGLRGLADRVSALDGRLDVESPPGGGTTVRAVLPCAS
jgi:signal transduction histidine kinase